MGTCHNKGNRAYVTKGRNAQGGSGGNMGGGENSDNKRIDLTGIPQSFLDRVMQNSPETFDTAIQRWRERYAESEKKLFSPSDIKVGDTISASKKKIGDDANVHNAENHAFWNVSQPSRTKTKTALDARDLIVTKVEKRKDGYKITANWNTQLEGFEGTKYRQVSRIFKDTDRVLKKK